jgi:hypothetical protein
MKFNWSVISYLYITSVCAGVLFCNGLGRDFKELPESVGVEVHRMCGYTS